MNPMIIALAGQIAAAESVAADASLEGRPARHYIVQTAAAKMPASVKAAYGRVAVLLVDADRESVSMISARAIGCHEVVATWEKRCKGTTERSAFRVAIREAEELAARLNRGE